MRFRPSAQADLEEHATSLALLAQDVADIPPELLDRAIQRHVRLSRFMPKAAELLDHAQAIVQADTSGTDFARQQLQDHCDALNRKEKRDVHWFVAGDTPNRHVSCRDLTA